MSRLLLPALLFFAVPAAAQSPHAFQSGMYQFIARTANFDPQFDAWRSQVAADSFRVFDPSGAIFLVSLAKVSGDTLQWTDVAGPCTGVVSRYKFAVDSIGIKLDVIDDECSDRAAAIVHMYIVPVKPDAQKLLPLRPPTLDLRP